MESHNNHLLLLQFLKTAEDHKVVQSSSYQKNIGAQFTTHLHIDRSSHNAIFGAGK